MKDELNEAAPPPSCSICSSNIAFHRPISKGALSNPKARNISDISSRLETSFVNVPYSPPNTTHVIDSNRKEWHGSEMYEVTRMLEGMTIAVDEILGMSNENVGTPDKYYCKSCLERIGEALDEHSSLVMNECRKFDEAASKEEERVDSIRGALAKLANNINLDTAVDEGHAVEWALDQFNLEIQALEQACTEQENEVKVLQNLMTEQLQRSKTILSQEQNAFHDLNVLERDVHNFNEESHHISNMCSSVFSEIDSLSRVKLVSIPFHIDVSQSHIGRYPLINNVRLAYRTNEKANLHREEINAAWVQAAQLVAFTCGLYPNFNTSLIRIIPLSHPCAKIQMLTTPSGSDGKNKHVYNLGWDVLSRVDEANHIPTPSLMAFLSLLSDLVSHIFSEMNHDAPPFEMTQCSIDNVDVSQLSVSDPEWSSVVYCIACNLYWLSRLPARMPCVL